MVNSKHVFWHAFIFAIVVFAIGVFFGFFLEGTRITKVEDALTHSETALLDEQLRNRVVEHFDVGCDIARNSTFSFADAIYNEALTLEKYDSSSKFRDELKFIHKRYDLLRMMLWLESIQLRKNCKNDFHTVIYLFAYDSDDLAVRARQGAISRVLVDLKEKYGGQILLIPIAANLNLEAVYLVAESYNITSLPAIIIDESKVIRDLVPFEDIETVVFKSNKQ